MRHFIQFRHALGTRTKYRAIGQRYRAFATEAEARPQDEITMARYVLYRVRQGVAASSIKGEVSALQHEWPGVGSQPLVRAALTASERVQDVARKAKTPITTAQMRYLRGEIWAAPSRLPNAREIAHLRLRDWTFYLMAFAGFFRGAELVALRWNHLEFTWLGADGLEATRRGPLPRDVAASDLRAVTVHVVRSKTDQRGAGQAVRLAALPEADTLDCPVRLLRRLARRRMAEDGLVFVDVRARYLGNGLQTSTLRSRLRQYLTSVLGSAAAKDFGLHSLRRGGATAAALLGQPVRLIKRQGRWQSDAVFLYTLFSDSELLSISSALLSELAS